MRLCRGECTAFEVKNCSTARSRPVARRGPVPCFALNFNPFSRPAHGHSEPGSKAPEDLPVVQPALVIPPPSRGSQYAPQNSWGSGGGRGGGIFDRLGFGGSGDGGDDEGQGRGKGRRNPYAAAGVWARVRLLLLSVGWACSVYIIFGSLLRLLRWVGSRLNAAGAGRALGLDGSSRSWLTPSLGHTPLGDSEMEEVSGYEEQEQGAAGTATAATLALPGNKASSSSGGGISNASVQGSSSIGGPNEAVLAASPAVVAEAGGPAISSASSSIGSSTTPQGAAADVVAAEPLTPEQRGLLELREHRKQAAAAGGIASESGHATAAYLLIMGTLAFFMIAN